MIRNLAPIILFCYNRPWHTEQTLDALMLNELASESVLYIYSDGPKSNASKKDVENIEAVRQVIRKKQWCKEVHFVEANTNKGLANSIIGGVAEVIERFGKVIVLEDDLLTSPYFLLYMNKALNFYEDYPCVFSISANRPPQNMMYIPDDYEYDVFVSLRSYSTGWATWRNRWEMVDWSLDDFDEALKHPFQINALNRGGEDVSKMLLMQKRGEIDSWALRFGFAHFKYHAVAILPCNAFVDNIGFDGTGTHSGTVDNIYRNNLSLAKINPKFLDVIYEDARIINAFYSRFYPQKRPIWKKAINFLFKKMGEKPPFILKAKVYYR
jgi:hypothetical protein